MRTFEEIINLLASRYRGGSSGGSLIYSYHKSNAEGRTPNVIFDMGTLKSGINKCLTMLWNDEEIVDAVPFKIENPTTPCLICLTNKYRMFVIKETTTTSGSFITFTERVPAVYITELERVDLNKCRILEIANTTLFGKPKPSINGTLILNDNAAFTNVDLIALQDVYNAILNNIKTYRDKPKATVTAAATKEKESSSSNNVAEIRKLYEDKIITREEMIELIKSLGS